MKVQEIDVSKEFWFRTILLNDVDVPEALDGDKNEDELERFYDWFSDLPEKYGVGNHTATYECYHSDYEVSVNFMISKI